MNIRRILLVGLGLMTLSAQAEPGHLRIQTTPAGAEVELDGIPQQPSPVTISDVAPGRHLIVLRKEGHAEERRSVSLLDGQQLSVDVTLEELAGLVLIHSVPPGAEINMSGAFRGRTPLMLPNVPLGTHRVSITLPGHFPREVELTVKDRTPLWLKADLVADSASIEVTSDPPGGRVTINGSDRGAAPLRAESVPTGEAEVVVTLDGYTTYRERVKVAAGGSYTVSANLRAQPGTLEIVTIPEKARIYVDNQFRGESPLVLEALPPGERRVRAELKGYETDARSVQVRAGERVTEEFRLVNNSGLLVLVTEPPGVKVIIDGVERGETTAQAAGLVSEALRIDTLARGEHTLQLLKAGYRHVPRKFSVEPGKAVTMTEKLVKIFNPDTRLLIRDEGGSENAIIGAFLQRHPNGDIEIETRPGVIMRVPAASILDRQSIRAGGN